jgi:hypothetical protein
MRHTCPNCQHAYDIPDREVLAQAARIMGRRGGRGCSEAKRAALAANAARPRPGRRKAAQDATAAVP